jgi:hypothetical protein
MKKSFCLVLLLGVLILAPSGAEAAVGLTLATASNASTNTVSTGTIKLTAVPLSTSANSEASLTLSYTGNRATFSLKNFGTETLNQFDITQTNPASTLQYCVGQDFKSNSSTRCADNSTAFVITLGGAHEGNNGTSGVAITFSTPLPPGTSYTFCSSVSKSGPNTVSISVSSSYITPSVTRS